MLNIQIVARPKKGGDWKAMPIPCTTEIEARTKIQEASEIMRQTFDFAIKTTKIEEVKLGAIKKYEQ